jgi:hypothetical protein
MRPLAVLVEFLVKPFFMSQFRDLIAANAKASLEREVACKRFDVLFDPEEPRRFASSRYLSFAGAIEGAAPSGRLAFSSAMATSEDDFT